MSEKINAQSLRKSRVILKLSLNEVSSFSKIAQSSLVEFEAGRKQPSINQIMRLAEIYNIDFYRFFDDDTIFPEQPLPDFRQQSPSASTVSIKGLKRIWAQDKISELTHELALELGNKRPTTYSSKSLSNRIKPDPSAIRSKFDSWRSNNSSKNLFSGNHVDQAIKYLRLFVELHNCPTSLSPAPINDYIGFYSENKNYRSIFVNSNVKNNKRRLFTLAHEFCHFLIGEEGISNPFHLENKVEKQCNSFASEFLAPEQDIDHLVKSAKYAGENRDIELIRQISERSLLSFQAAAIRLNQLEYIPSSARQTAFALYRRDEGALDPVPPSPTKEINGFSKDARAAIKISEIGILPAYTASLACQQKLIDHVDVKRGLNIPEDIQPHVFKLATIRYEGGTL